MDGFGVCSICFKAFSVREAGYKCCKCLRIYHTKCAEIKNVTRDYASNWCCSSCVFQSKMQFMIVAQQNLINKIPQLIADEVATQLSRFERKCLSLVEPIKNEVNVLTKSIDYLSKSIYHMQGLECRKDIIIHGIPIRINDSKDIRDIVLKIAAFYGVTARPEDIYQCTRLQKDNNILVKFSNLFTRDDIMQEYFKNMVLTLNQIMHTNIKSRIFLNDNYSPVIQRSICYCNKLRKLNLIAGFYVDFKSGQIYTTSLDNTIVKYSNLQELVANHNIPRKASAWMVNW